MSKVGVCGKKIAKVAVMFARQEQTTAKPFSQIFGFSCLNLNPFLPYYLISYRFSLPVHLVNLRCKCPNHLKMIFSLLVLKLAPTLTTHEYTILSCNGLPLIHLRMSRASILKINLQIKYENSGFGFCILVDP